MALAHKLEYHALGNLNFLIVSGKVKSPAIFCLALSISLMAAAEKLAAQTETVIDGHNSAEAQSLHNQEAGWCAGVNPDTTLETHFTIDDPHPQPGHPFNYELLITNTGEKTITLPRALDWKVVDTNGLEQQYVKAGVSLELRTEKVVTYITPTLVLYSVPGKPETMLTLRPGDSLRILGTSVLPTGLGPEWAGQKTLIGHLCLHSVSQTFRQTPIGRREGGSRQQMLWCANAVEQYQVNPAPER